MAFPYKCSKLIFAVYLKTEKVLYILDRPLTPYKCKTWSCSGRTVNYLISWNRCVKAGRRNWFEFILIIFFKTKTWQPWAKCLLAFHIVNSVLKLFIVTTHPERARAIRIWTKHLRSFTFRFLFKTYSYTVVSIYTQHLLKLTAFIPFKCPKKERILSERFYIWSSIYCQLTLYTED